MSAKYDLHERPATAPKPEAGAGGAASPSGARPGRAAVPQAAKLAGLVAFVVFLGMCLVSLLNMLAAGRGPAEVTAGLGIMSLLLGLQWLYFSGRLAYLDQRTRIAVLIAQVLIAYLPLLHFRQAWVAMPGFLAGSVLLSLAPRCSWIFFTMIVASMTVVQATLTPGVLEVAYTGISTVITGLVVYGLSRLAALVTDVHEARVAMTQIAVTNERLRVARDLHDLLGFSLSAATLKAELAQRLIQTDPVRASGELAEILNLTRQALADMRRVSYGYRTMSLDAEIRSICSVFHDADIDVVVTGSAASIPDRVGTVLATVLREGATNVLRHSTARSCLIDIGNCDDSVYLRMVNDGVRPGPPAGPRQGTGIEGLTTRVAELGGALTAELVDDEFRVLLCIPLHPAPGGMTAAPAGSVTESSGVL